VFTPTLLIFTALARILILPQPAVITPWNKEGAKNKYENENEKQQSAKVSEN
jgi:hypothetical protein